MPEMVSYFSLKDGSQRTPINEQTNKRMGGMATHYRLVSGLGCSAVVSDTRTCSL